MPQIIKLRKGFDIALVGKAEKKISGTAQPELFALKPSDFIGIQRPKLLADEGQNVKAGTSLLFDKKAESIMYASPISGEIVEIVRGEKRKLLEIKILADKEIEYENFDSYSVSEINNLNRKDIVEQLLTSGAWPQIIQRPFGIVADPVDEPKSIFISGFDTHPLAPDYEFIFSGKETYFQAGINVLKKLTSGNIHLGIKSDAEFPTVFSQVEGVQIDKFTGPHPSGNVGVQIHHVDPINKGEVCWTVSPFGVIQIGQLFLEGKLDSSKMIAIAGSEVNEPQYYQTYTGASVSKILSDNLKSDNVRVISGNVLTGEGINKDGFVGYYDQMITVIPEGDYYELFGWIKPSFKKLSFQKAFGLFSYLNKNAEYTLDTNMRGERRPFVQTGVFEKVLPMDIYPTYLLKAIMAEDFDDMESLGIYEVVEEDLALCEFIDVSKHDVQRIVREGIDLIRFS